MESMILTALLDNPHIAKLSPMLLFVISAVFT